MADVTAKPRTVHIKTGICDKDLGVMLFRYQGNDRLAIELWELDESGRPSEPFYRATVNVPEAYVPEGHVLLKGWSENLGLPQAMVEAGIVELTGVKVPTGMVEAEEAKLLREIDEIEIEG